MSNDQKKKWVTAKYPSSGLQVINTQSFKSAFIHTPKEKKWGWSDSYIRSLSERLNQNTKLCVIDLAIWVFKDKEWDSKSTLQNVLDFFLQHYRITEEEKEQLFIEGIDSYSDIDHHFQEKCIDWSTFHQFISLPPDAPQDRGAVLSYLSLTNVGPAASMAMKPSRRLNIITGDNALGKTFLIECVWWAMTGIWAEKLAYPKDIQKRSEISYRLSNGQAKATQYRTTYNISQGQWTHDTEIPSLPGLMIYARVDGSYTVWDPIKPPDFSFLKNNNFLTFENILDGVSGIIEGLLRDWVKWRMDTKKYPFDILADVLKTLSPPDMGELRPGLPVRLPNDAREFPTIIHPYGEIPIIYLSAGIKRIVSLAYLIVWAWYEHKEKAKLYRTSTENRMIILVDEVEAHLHPKWQRTILPALLCVQNCLSKELEIQLIISTHSPLVMASVETCFDNQQDKLFHLDMNIETREAELNEKEFEKRGQINSWLVSPVFELKHARSQEAETAIENAKKLQLQNSSKLQDIVSVHNELLRCLAETDSFWPRWIFFAEKHGVKL
ncbi:MAG: ATP-binding protein [Planctomycetaceae bacterium]|nr:ATP-binding protein [Planctomycetaceae bacterium]